MSTGYDRKDRFYQKAKAEGFRSRAAYKIQELNQKFKLMRRGSRVLDLGAWPGGWLQVAAQTVGEEGIVAGIDLKEITPFGAANVHLFTGDVRDEALMAKVLAVFGGPCDLVLSDMSPNISGIKEADQAASIACAELALFIAQQTLKADGNLVIKVFKGNDTELFVKTMRPLFNKIARAELDSTRKTSNEFYLVGLGLKR